MLSKMIAAGHRQVAIKYSVRRIRIRDVKMEISHQAIKSGNRVS